MKKLVIEDPVDGAQGGCLQVPPSCVVLIFNQNTEGREIRWALDGFQYWAALVELRDMFKTWAERGYVGAEMQQAFYDILDNNHVDLDITQ